MFPRTISRRSMALVALTVALVGMVTAVVLPGHRQARADGDPPLARAAQSSPPAPLHTNVTVLPVVHTPPLPPGFVGVSVEYPAIAAYAGPNPRAVNPVLKHLIRNLAPGQRPVVRIGGDSSDESWFPTRGIKRPAGIRYTLTTRRVAVIASLAHAIDARMILGLDLEAGQIKLTLAEAHALLSRIGTHSVESLEIGNEPLRYRIFAWYRTPTGQLRWARPRTYDFAAFNHEFASVARLLPKGIGVAGPTMGGRRWMGNLGTFIATEPKLNAVTFHNYPLSRCAKVHDLTWPTVPRLLSAAASRAVEQRLADYVVIARQHHIPFRLDETNSASCGGRRQVSGAFASALWAIDNLFTLAKIGVTGVNFHTFPKAGYELFNFRHSHGQWLTRVRPIYYGLMLFARAAPAGSRLLQVKTNAGPNLRAWSTRAPDGTVRVVLINADLTRANDVQVRLPPGGTQASLLRLTASSAYATTGVELGTRRFGRHTDGSLPPLVTEAVPRLATGLYQVTLAPSSAALLTLARR